MFQFAEILTLSIGIITAVYVLAHWRSIRANPHLGPLVGPFLLMLLSWVATVVEGALISSPQTPVLFLAQPSMGVTAAGGTWAHAWNLVEHTSLTLSGVWLMVSLLRMSRRAREPAA